MLTMPQAIPSAPRHLGPALLAMLKNPVRTLVPPWSWKAAAFSAVLRALAFFATNLRSGSREATKAMLIEGVFAVFASGLVGAISQRLRDAQPLWATALVVWLGLPGLLLLGQAEVHHLARTPHLGGGLLLSFCLAAGASAFTWYAMRHGAMLGGADATTFAGDMRSLPGITLDFLLAGPRMTVDALRHKKP